MSQPSRRDRTKPLAFIVALVIMAMLVLAVRPDGEEQIDLDEQNRPDGH